jgi:hypothetical protein
MQVAESGRVQRPRRRIFTNEHLRRLRAHKLDDESIARLEHSCIIARNHLAGRRPLRGEVSENLDRIRKAARQLSDAMDGAPGGNRVNLYSEGVSVHEFVDQLAALTEAVDRLDARLANYKDTGNKPIAPIMLMARAVGPCVKLTTTETGPFGLIVRVCYEAMGLSDEDFPSRRTIKQALDALELHTN